MAELPMERLDEETTIEMRKAKMTWVQRAHEARLTRLTRTIGGRYDIEVRLNNRNMACTDGNTVWLPRDLDEDPAANLIMQEAIAAHEAAGHLRYTDFKAWIEMSESIQAGETDRTLAHMVNILEDARINHLLAQDYRGSGLALQFTQDRFTPKYIAKFGDNEQGRDCNPRVAALAMTAMECIANEASCSPLPEVEAYLKEVRPLFADSISQPNTTSVIKTSVEILEIFRKHFPVDGSSEQAEQQFGSETCEGLVDDHDIDQLKNMKRMQSKVKVNRKVNKKRYEDLKTSGDVNKMADKPGTDEGEGEGKESDTKGEGARINPCSEGDNPGDGEGNGEDGGEGEGEGSGKTGEGGMEKPFQDDEVGDAFEGSIQQMGENDGSRSPAEGAYQMENQEVETEEYWELLSDTKSAVKELDYDAIEMEDTFSATREASDGGLTVEGRGEGFLDKWGHEIGIIGTPSTIVNENSYGGQVDRYNRVVRRQEQQIRTLVAEIKRRLAGRESDFSRFERRGQVDSRSVWNMEASDRIFKKRSRIKRPHAAGIMLIDASGSMGCGAEGGKDRAYYATEAAIVLAEVMARCNFDFEVVDFNSDSGGRGGYGYTSMNVRKPLGGKPTDISKAAIATDHVGYSNGDGFAVQWCIDRVQTVEADARFVFVLSDGAPAGPHPADMNCHSHLVHVVENCPKDVELFSIGVAGCRTNTFYGDKACDINGTSEVAEKVVPIVRKALRNVKRKVVI